MIELNFFCLMKYNIFPTFVIREFKKFLFFIRLFICLNLFFFNPINSAGNIPTSDKTENLPPIKSL